MQRWRSGRTRTTRNRVTGNCTGVQIPLSAPIERKLNTCVLIFYIIKEEPLKRFVFILIKWKITKFLFSNINS